MKIIFCVILFWSSFFSVSAGEIDNISSNSLIATYYANARSQLKSKPHDCIFWADKAIGESKIGGNKLELGRSLFIKASALEYLHQYKSAVTFFQESLKVAENCNYCELEIDALSKISALYAKRGDYKSAVLYATLLHDRKDSNTRTLQRVLAKTLPGKADLIRREIKMKQLLSDNTVLDNHMRSNLKMIDDQGKWIFIIIIGYTLIFLFFVLIRHQNKLILLKNHELTAQMHSLESGKMELDHVRYKAEESDRLKTAFLANISHEIRTPLNAIVSFSGFLRQKGKPVAERKKYIDIIHQYSESLLSLINEIFEVARIEAGEIKQDPEVIDVDAFLKNIHAQYCSENSRVVKKGLKLILNLRPNEPDCYINTYPERLKNVVLHLIENALKYSANGKVELGYVVKDLFIEFYLMDDGKDFPKDKIEDVFERFKTNVDFSKPGMGPLGLGVTISKNFIESMGGSIWVIRNDNKGLTFFFTLPTQLDIKT